MLNTGYSKGRKAIKQIIRAFPNVNPNGLFAGIGEMLLELEGENKRKDNAIEVDPNDMKVNLVTKYAYVGYMKDFGDAEYIEMLPMLCKHKKKKRTTY